MTETSNVPADGDPEVPSSVFHDVPCPRCAGAAIPGMPRVRSRATDDQPIDICAPCGCEESLEQVYDGAVAPVDAWPVVDPYRHTDSMGETIGLPERLSRVPKVHVQALAIGFTAVELLLTVTSLTATCLGGDDTQ